MATSKTMMVLPDDCESIEDLQLFLNTKEKVFSREIVDFGLAQGSTKFNVADYVISANAKDLLPISIFVIDPAKAESTLRNLLNNYTPIAYTPALIGGKETDILVARDGASLKLNGRMSTFGGPKDSGMSVNEGLALIQDQHLAALSDYFNPGSTRAYGRNLNPLKFYIACRWNRSITPYSWLRKIKVTVRNPITGLSAQAQPVDWGPAKWTGRVADLSPGLAKYLSLNTDDTCEVTIPLPRLTPLIAADATSNTPQREALTQIASKQFTLYNGIRETNSPLREQIRQYWEEIGEAFPAKGVGEAWSAVFVSWCVKAAGAVKADFKFSPRHSIYVKEAIGNALRETGSFRAFPLSKYPPRIGDIIHENRNKGSVSYKEAEVNGDYDSHCAIVVSLGDGASGRFALTIGGNEGDSVRQSEVLLDQDGRVKQREIEPFICVIRTFDNSANPS